MCGVISAFVHSTVSPFFISSSGGSNFMFFIVTCATAGALESAAVFCTALAELLPV